MWILKTCHWMECRVLYSHPTDILNWCQEWVHQVKVFGQIDPLKCLTSPPSRSLRAQRGGRSPRERLWSGNCWFHSCWAHGGRRWSPPESPVPLHQAGLDKHFLLLHRFRRLRDDHRSETWMSSLPAAPCTCGQRLDYWVSQQEKGALVFDAMNKTEQISASADFPEIFKVQKCQLSLVIKCLHKGGQPEWVELHF